MSDDAKTPPFPGCDDRSNFEHFPPSADGQPCLVPVAERPPEERPQTGGKTLPAPVERRHPRKQANPKQNVLGTAAIREIQKLQKSTDLVVPRANFSRLVREILRTLGPGDLRIQSSALDDIQTAAEEYVHDVLRTANWIREVSNTKTLMGRHIEFAIEKKEQKIKHYT